MPRWQVPRKRHRVFQGRSRLWDDLPVLAHYSPRLTHQPPGQVIQLDKRHDAADSSADETSPTPMAQAHGVPMRTETWYWQFPRPGLLELGPYLAAGLRRVAWQSPYSTPLKLSPSICTRSFSL